MCASMNTWILDVAFQRNAIKSECYQEMKLRLLKYFEDKRLAGSSLICYQFLANCIATRITDHIILLQIAS